MKSKFTNVRTASLTTKQTSFGMSGLLFEKDNKNIRKEVKYATVAGKLLDVARKQET